MNTTAHTKTQIDSRERRRRAVIAGVVVAAGVIAVLALIIAFSDVSSDRAYTSSEVKCMEFVQGNIPWNSSGDTDWTDEALETLCEGTRNPPQPGLCFDRVMHNGVDLDEEIHWRWREAAALCAGTNDAKSRIACFAEKIQEGRHWKSAIAECGKGQALTPEDRCFTFVQGNIPWNASGNVNWEPTYVKKLCEGTFEAAQPGLCFNRVMGGAGQADGDIKLGWKQVVELCAGTSDAGERIRCFRDKSRATKDWKAAISACKRSDKRRR